MTALATGAWAGVAAAAFGVAGAPVREQLIAGAAMASAVLFFGAWASAKKRKRRWREVEHLERSLFAAAGGRRKWRPRS